MAGRYTKRQIMEAIRYWERRLAEAEALDEGFKNWILSKIGMRSDNIDLEDLVDLVGKRGGAPNSWDKDYPEYARLVNDVADQFCQEIVKLRRAVKGARRGGQGGELGADDISEILRAYLKNSVSKTGDLGRYAAVVKALTRRIQRKLGDAKGMARSRSDRESVEDRLSAWDSSKPVPGKIHKAQDGTMFRVTADAIEKAYREGVQEIKRGLNPSWDAKLRKCARVVGRDSSKEEGRFQWW